MPLGWKAKADTTKPGEVDQFDAALRLIEDVLGDMVVVPLGPDQRFIVLATPEYLDHIPAPERPADLAHHTCIRARMPSGRIIPWEFARHGEAGAARKSVLPQTERSYARKAA